MCFVVTVKAQTVCDISTSVQENLIFLSNNYKMLKNGTNDKCVLRIIDSLQVYSNKNDTLSLSILSKISSISDGYISESIMDAVTKVYYPNAFFLIKWMYKNQNTMLEKRLIEGLSMQVSMKKSKELQKIKLIANQAKLKLTVNESEYLDSIINGINPKIWD